jgi:NDP-sugar pyrophosphorylase family protein
MAGKSERFRDAGYLTPKAFMDVDGRAMIHWVCDMFSPEDEFVFVVQKAHAGNPAYREILEAGAPRARIVGIDPHDRGPTVSALAADGIVGDDEPVIFTYCDFYQHWNYRQFLRSVEGYDGGIAVFKGFHPASFGDTYYAYLRCNDKGDLLELREKRSFTEARHEERASSGVYYVRSWGLFKRFAEVILAQDAMSNGEYYLSLIFNPMVEAGLRVTTYRIERFICWGTPDDVEQYAFWSDFFRHDVARILGRNEAPETGAAPKEAE